MRCVRGTGERASERRRRRAARAAAPRAPPRGAEAVWTADCCWNYRPVERFS
jgi:hypothetical protein